MVIPYPLLWFFIAVFFIIVAIYILNKRILQTLASTLLFQHEHVEKALLDQLSPLREAIRHESIHLSEQIRQLDQRTQAQWLNTRSELMETLLERLHLHTQSSQTVLIQSLESTTRQLNERIEQLSGNVHQRLVHLSENVEQRLNSGFQNTHETFTRVMSRLATIDEAQKKIEGLTTNVISLNQLLGDKRARGAFGEVQLESLITDSLPPNAYTFQSAIPNHPHTRPDCLLTLPPPTGNIVIDAKFPLENYQRHYDPNTTDTEKQTAIKMFQHDVRRHIDAIAAKYILPPDTGDCAMLFIPAEAVFAEIHAHHPEIVAYSQNKRVWLTSPTTLMAVLNTARAVIRDKETREHIHSIQNALSALSIEFKRFDDRMQKLAKHIKQVSEDVSDIHVTSHKITRHFRQIEHADVGALATSAFSESSTESHLES